MIYPNPESVISPKGAVKDVRVVYDTGVGGWSMAKLLWNDKEALGIRWNGNADNTLGNPQSRGIPTWFILPEDVANLVHRQIAADEFRPESLPSEGDKLHLRPLPRRIWQGREQTKCDDAWLVVGVDPIRGTIKISNISTGHFLTLYPAHVQGLIPSTEPSQNGQMTHTLQLNGQMIFEDGHVRIEPLWKLTD